MKVKEEIHITRAQAKHILSKKKSLGYEQKNALEFLNKFTKLDAQSAQTIMQELEGFKKLNEKQKTLIMDFLPKTPEEIDVLLANEIVSLSADEKGKIAELCKKHS